MDENLMQWMYLINFFNILDLVIAKFRNLDCVKEVVV